MNHAYFVGLLSFGLFLGMLLFMEVGRRLGLRRRARDPELAKAGFGAIKGGVLALLGLLLAFTFSGAGARFDVRRQLVVEETNAIGTVYLRLDMLPTAAQPALRENFRRYVETRLMVYRKVPDMAAVKEELAKANILQKDIWLQAVAAVRSENAPLQAAVVLLPAFNLMIDITTTQTMAAQMHPPVIIFAMLFVLALVSSLLAGYGMAGGKSRSWFHVLCFAVVIAVAVYVILDMEYPRLGLIRVDAFDQALVDLRNGMK
jgi:cytochrome c oxidase subunit IV